MKHNTSRRFNQYKIIVLLIICAGSLSAWHGFHYVNNRKKSNLIYAVIDSMSLKQKIGQLIMLGIREPDGKKISDEYIEKYCLGGVILFKDSLRSQAQVKKMISDMQEAAVSSAGVPLFIAVDQEGGTVNRVGLGLTHIPGNMAISAAGSEKYARIAGEIQGMELRSLGINLNLAPCVDVLKVPSNEVIGTRSFGSETLLVAQFARAYFQGLKKYNVLGCAKHFPNHGAVKEDSHTILPESGMLKEEMLEDAVPYRMLIEDDIDMIMPAHINWNRLDAKNVPGTISERMIYGLLRTELGYKGVVISDALEMDAVAESYSIADAAVKFIQAGGDLILLGKRYDNVLSIFQGLTHAVEIGAIAESRIDESLYRILSLKLSLFKEFQYTKISDGAAEINWDENKQWAYRIAKKSIRRYGKWGRMPVITPDTRILMVSSSTGWKELGKDNFNNTGYMQIPRKPKRYKYHRNRLAKELNGKNYSVIALVSENKDQSDWYQYVLQNLPQKLPSIIMLSEDLSCLQNPFFQDYPIVEMWGPSVHSRRAAIHEVLQ